MLPALAIAAAALAVGRRPACLRAWLETRRVVRGWHARDESSHRGLPVSTVDSALPVVVALVGIVRPRLYIARPGDRVVRGAGDRRDDRARVGACRGARQSGAAAVRLRACRCGLGAPPGTSNRRGRGRPRKRRTIGRERPAPSLTLASALAKVARMGCRRSRTAAACQRDSERQRHRASRAASPGRRSRRANPCALRSCWSCRSARSRSSPSRPRRFCGWARSKPPSPQRSKPWRSLFLLPS